MTKQDLRNKIRIQKKFLTPEQIVRAENSLVDAFLSNAAFLRAKTILLYASMPDEVPTMKVLRTFSKGINNELPPKRLLLPCVVGETELEIRHYTTESDLVLSGKYKIPEPIGPLYDFVNPIDLVIVPGMAFDNQCHRLGRGKGYYDRLLTQEYFRNVPKLGVCFDFQFVEQVPIDVHDCAMDEVIVISSK